jgi:hypothetical protein
VRLAPLLLLLALPLHAEDVCTPGYSQRHRHVTLQTKRRVYRKAGVPWGTRGYVVDHREPVCLGGSNDLANLQLQTVAESRVKDRLERQTCRDYCAGGITLEEARGRFSREDRSGVPKEQRK